VNISGIGSRIISLREDKNWSQRGLAKRVGISPSVMNRIELEERPIKDFELDILASVLETTTDYLLGRELYEVKVTYNPDKKINNRYYSLGINHIPKQLVEKLQQVQPEDMEEIKRHIDYVIYRRKEKNQLYKD